MVAYLHACVTRRLVQLDTANWTWIIFRELGLFVACHL